MEELTKKEIQELKMAYLKYTGKEISDEKVKELLAYLTRLVLPVYY